MVAGSLTHFTGTRSQPTQSLGFCQAWTPHDEVSLDFTSLERAKDSIFFPNSNECAATKASVSVLAREVSVHGLRQSYTVDHDRCSGRSHCLSVLASFPILDTGGSLGAINLTEIRAQRLFRGGARV